MTSPDPGAQSGTDPNAQSGETGTGQGAPGTDPSQTGQSTDPAQGQQPTDTNATVSRAEYDALLARMRAADQNRSKAELELKNLKDKDIPALEKAQRDLAEANRKAEEAAEALKASRIENAFLADNKYKWKNPKTALKLADLSKVEVLEDGSVSGLSAALEALAKSDPYLIDTEPTPETKGSTGAPGAGGGGKPGDGKLDMKALTTRFPAMRTRGVSGN